MKIHNIKYKYNVLFKSNDSKADKFYNKNLIKKYFGQWKEKKTDWHVIYNHYHIQPIIYWSLTLSKKVLEGWKQYSKQKSNMRKRMADAEKWKIDNDLKKGIVTWIRVIIKIYI